MPSLPGQWLRWSLQGFSSATHLFLPC
jgi:hypothetical protein